MFTLAFWLGASERAVSTAAQTLLALVGTDALGWLALDWSQIGVASAIAGGLSVVKSLAAGAKDGNPSVGSVETLAARGHIDLHKK